MSSNLEMILKRLQSTPSNKGKNGVPPQILSDDAIETEGVDPTDLVGQYDQDQKDAQEQEDKELEAIEATNPHNLFMDVVTAPCPRGYHQMTLMGRPVDLRKLEKYVVFGMSPKSTVTTLRYNEVKAYEDAQGYGRTGTVTRGKKGSLGKVLLIIVLCVIGLLIGIVMLTKGPELMKMFGLGGAQLVWAGRSLRNR